MKRLLLLLLLSLPAVAQLPRYDAVVLRSGTPNGPANVAVCQSSGSGGPPCIPLAVVYSDANGNGQISQPFSADMNGHYYFYAAAGTYVVNTYGNGYVNTLTTITLTGGGTGGGAVSSVSNSDGTLTIAPTTGAVVSSLNLAQSNAWSVSQTFANIIDSGLAITANPICPNGSGGTFTTVGCTAAGLTGLTTGVIPQATSATTIANSSPQLDNGVTAANTLTYAGSGGIHTTNATTAGTIQLIGNTANPSVTANSAGFIGPPSASFTGYALQFPATGPTNALPVMSCNTPVSGVSTCTFAAGGATPTLDQVGNLATNATQTFAVNSTWTLNGTAPAAAASGTNAVDEVDSTAPTGGAANGTNALGGKGGGYSFTTGAGGASTGTSANSNGGDFVINGGAAGTGGSGAAGKVGNFLVTAFNMTSTAAGALTIPSLMTASSLTLTSASSSVVGNATTSSLLIHSGQDFTSNTAAGSLTVRGADNTGAGGAAARGGSVVIRGGNNTSTNASSKAGSLQVQDGASTGATQGIQGLLSLAHNFVKGATVTQWNVQCVTAANTVQDCTASSVKGIVGVAETVNTNTVITIFSGLTLVNATAAVTIGDNVCMGATAGQVTDSATGCAVGTAVGIVVDTGGSYTLGDGTVLTPTTTLPLIQIQR